MKVMAPHVLIEQIGEIKQRGEFEPDTIGLDGRIREIESLFAARAQLSSSGILYERRKEHVITTQEAILRLAQYGYPNEALDFSLRYFPMWAEFIPPEDRI